MNNQSDNQTSSNTNFRFLKLNRWNVSIVAIALLMALPVLVVASFLFLPFNENWTHLYDYLLKDYITNSLILMVGVSAGVLSIGITTAWLTSMCEFPGRRFFSWALLLPLAIPAYIIAYTYTGMLDFAGPLQTLIRETFGWGPRITGFLRCVRLVAQL